MSKERHFSKDNGQHGVLNFTPDFHDTMPATTLDNQQVEYMVQEIHELNTQIHEYLRIFPTTMGLAITLIAGATALYTTSRSDIVHHSVLFVLPILVGILFIYHFNVSTDVAVLAEIRDRLSYRVNKALGRPVFVTRLASDILRGSIGTWLLLGPIGFLLCLMMILGVVSAWGIRWLFVIQLVSNLSVATAVFVSFKQIPIKRALTNVALDETFTIVDRPSSAAQTKDNLLKQLTVNRDRKNQTD